MSETTITIRGIDSNTWKEFQRGIVNLHGNLYGNIGLEVTNALRLWFEQYQGIVTTISIPSDKISASHRDIGGLKEEIKMIREIVEIPLRHPELFKWLNLIPTKGVLISGPPGTGKTLLAKAAASEAKAQLYILSLQEMIPEFNERKLRGVFIKAKENPPSVILIPDLKILSTNNIEETDHGDQILTSLLSEMDNLEDFGQVIVEGILSSPEELKPSLQKRFQQEIRVSFPDKQGRYEILKIQTSDMPLEKDVDLEKLAETTDKQTGDFLWRMCQEAATSTLRRILKHNEIKDEEISKERLERIKVNMDDFLNAFKRLVK
jgi:transitional endoplasmic reticulum ATPase